MVIEEITDMGRMAAVMPVLQFICKELHVNSAEFRSILRDTALDRCHLEWTLGAERWMTWLLINLYIMFSSQFFRESAVQILIEFMLYGTQFGTPLLQMHVWKPKAASRMYFLQLLEPSYLLFKALYIWALTSFSPTSSLSQFTPHLSPLDRREDGISLREASGANAT